MKLETEEHKSIALIFIAPEKFAFLENFFLQQENSSYLLDMFFEKTQELFSQTYITKTPFFSNYIEKYSLQVLPQDSEIALMNQIWKSNSASVALIENITPLIDKEIVQELFDIHEKYLADFTYAENLPVGMGVDFFAKSFLQTFHYIHNSKEEDLGSFHHVAAYAKKNIEKFHTEIHFVEPDLRNYRLQLTLNNKRNYHFVSTVLEHSSAKDANKTSQQDFSLKQLQMILQEHPSLMALKPAYLEIELTSACEYSCSFCPRTFLQESSKEREEKIEHIDTDVLLTRLQEFREQSFDDTAIALGGMGEPLEHPQAKKILENILQETPVNENVFDFVLLETNGLYLSLLEDLDKPMLEKLRVIVNINSIKNYAELHGCEAENFERIYTNIKALKERYEFFGVDSKEHIWIQTLKMEENEQEIDALFELSDSLQVSFLLQKYNRFLFMPEKRLSDMTPLERFFCWHLARDLYIRSDASVALCKQDVENKCIVGTANSLKEKSIEEIFETHKPYFAKNFHGDYSLCQCEQCDEYYTFNN